MPNYSNYSEGSLTDGILDVQFNLLFLPINSNSAAAETMQEEIERLKDDDEDDDTVYPDNYNYNYDYSVVTNVLVYDIPKNIKTPFFLEGELETGCVVNSFIFETAYDEKMARMLMGASSYNIRNNCNIEEREPKNKVIVEVYNNHKSENQLWLADKWGLMKQCIARWSDSTGFSWHIDLFNSVIRLMHYDGSNWNIVEHDW